jgi:RHS repeat-associated protein
MFAVDGGDGVDEVEIPFTRSTFVYDDLGNKISDTDPDKGTWTYQYNARGELLSQTDAKGQVTKMTYDVIGRMVERIDDATKPDPASRRTTWTYDNSLKGTGTTETVKGLGYVASPGYAATYFYDQFARPIKQNETVDGIVFSTQTTFDAYSRPATVQYPSGLKIKNNYNAYGFIASVQNAVTNAFYWTGNTVDARGNFTQVTLGNGVVTTKAFDPQRGFISGIYSKKAGGPLLQDLTYDFDVLGNLTERADGKLLASSLVETSTYDGLNRLTSSKVTKSGTGAFTSTVSVTYDRLGNIRSKSDIGTYTYTGGICGGGSHAVKSVAGTKNATYCYDANGNMISGNGRQLSYTSYDLPFAITEGTIKVGFLYGPDRQRFKRIDTLPTGVTRTIYASGGAFERIMHPDGSIDEKSYLGDFAIVTENTKLGVSTLSTHYLGKDHIGSTDTITDASGALVQKMSFDAWGKRRQATWQGLASPLYFNTLVTTNGFTGHEMLDSVGLIHMNGRVYDPEIGRFVQADPVLQDTTNLQAWNRYSYVLNNPLSMTDPTGFFFGSIVNAIGDFISGVAKAIVSVFKAVLKIPLVRAVVQIAACGASFIACLAVTGGMELVAGGGLQDALKAMAWTAASFGTWGAVGDIITPTVKLLAKTSIEAAMIFKGAVHGVVGGALSVAQGGDFVDGFISNAVGARNASLAPQAKVELPASSAVQQPPPSLVVRHRP